jgi:isoquinoline 1-oxidoreductase beta subunit
MFTGNSESTQAFFELMRRTGAAAREMLLQAAATRWGVPADECRAEKSRVVHDASGRRLTFGEVAEDAAMLAAPSTPRLKASSELTLIGRPASTSRHSGEGGWYGAVRH